MTFHRTAAALITQLQISAGIPPLSTLAFGLTDEQGNLVAYATQNGLTFNGGLTLGSGGAAVSKILSTTVSWDPASLNSGASEKKSSITLTGVAVGDVVTASLSTIVSSDWDVQAVVTAADTVEVKITNNTGGTVNLASGTLRVNCIKF